MPQPENKWYSIRARAGNPKAAQILIYGDIGESFFEETVTAKDFVRELSALPAEEITVRINSYGGSVSDGIAIHNALKRHKANVTVSIDGVAASIASLIAMAGDTVEMADNALMMIHAPFGMSLGNSEEMRKFAELLDTWAQAMATSYAAKTGKPQSEILGLLTDGEDHWFTAQEAFAEKLIDKITDGLPIAASYDRQSITSRLRSQREIQQSQNKAASAAQAITIVKEIQAMPIDKTQVQDQRQQQQPDTANTQQVDAALNESEIKARALAADKQRRVDIRAAYSKFGNIEGAVALQIQCEEDHQCSPETANAKLLAHIGAGATPISALHVVTVKDETDKFRDAAVESIMARAAARDSNGAPIRVSAANPYRGHKLLDFARASLNRAGIKTEGMGQMEIVAAAFTQSTSDFPVLLETTMHRTLQQAYAVAPDTWSRFCRTGSVSDFRAHPRYRVGSIGNLDKLLENSEFKNKSIPDGEKSSVTADTKGNIIAISRKMIVNDDLGAFVGLAEMLGRAAKRTIEADVYAQLALNAGMGPTMLDGVTLFHVNHNNIAGAGALSVGLIDDGRVKMASQKDISGNDFLDLRPAVWLGPMGSGGDARVINDAQFDPDTVNKLQRPNKVRGLFRDVVDTPRLSGTRFYMFADPADAAVLEVAFLDGVQEPFLELQNGFDVDGARYKVRLDFGIAAIDFRGAVTAAGA